MIKEFGGVAFDSAKPQVVEMLEGFVQEDELERLYEVRKSESACYFTALNPQHARARARAYVHAQYHHI